MWKKTGRILTILIIIYMTAMANAGAESTAMSIANWSTGFVSNSSAGIFVDADVKISRDVFHSGTASAQLISRSAKSGNVYVRFKNDISGMEDDKSYICTFWAKAQELTEVSARVAWGTETTSLELAKGTYDWREYTFEFPNTSHLTSTNLSFLVLDKCGSLWIDDVGFYEKGSDEKPTGENLILNPGFEIGLDTIAPREVEDVKVIAGDGKLNISWKNPSDKDFNRVQVCRVSEDGSESIEAYVEKTNNSVLIENLTNGREYRFKLYAMDTSDNRSDGAEAKGTPVEPMYRVTAPVFDKINEQGEVIQENLTELTPGLIRCTTTIQNNGMGNDFDAEMILTVHNGGVLVNAVSEYVYAAEGGKEQILSAVIEVPELADAEYKIEAFIWNYLSGMKPLANFGTIY